MVLSTGEVAKARAAPTPNASHEVGVGSLPRRFSERPGCRVRAASIRSVHGLHHVSDSIAHRDGRGPRTSWASWSPTVMHADIEGLAASITVGHLRAWFAISASRESRRDRRRRPVRRGIDPGEPCGRTRRTTGPRSTSPGPIRRSRPACRPRPAAISRSRPTRTACRSSATTDTSTACSRSQRIWCTSHAGRSCTRLIGGVQRANQPGRDRDMRSGHRRSHTICCAC